MESESKEGEGYNEGVCVKLLLSYNGGVEAPEVEGVGPHFLWNCRKVTTGYDHYSHMIILKVLAA